MKISPLVIRFGALGDMVLTTPLLRALAHRFGSPVDIVTRGNLASELFKHLPFVGSIRTIEHRNGPFILNPDQWSVLQWMKSYRESPVYLLETDPKSTWLCRKAGITNLISALHVRRRVNEHTVDFQSRLGSHETSAKSVPFERYDRGLELTCSDEERSDVMCWLESLGCADHPIIVFQVGNRKVSRTPQNPRNIKDWPEDRWIDVMHGLFDHDSNVRILMTGTGTEASMINRIARTVGDPRIIPLPGLCSLRRLIALLQVSHSMISVDTGPAHIAAAVNCPLIVLFGKTDPRTNMPIARHSPVVVVTGPYGAKVLDGARAWAQYHSMDGIYPRDVMDAWITHLLPNRSQPYRHVLVARP